MSKDDLEYGQMTDEELLDRLRDGEESVMDYICNKYKKLVRSRAKSMYIPGADREDLIQEGMLGLFKAIRDYDGEKAASFSTFAQLCISRQLYTAVEASQRKKHIPLNTYISLYGSTEEKDTEERHSLLEALEDTVGRNPEEHFLAKERADYLEQRIEEELSDFEKQVLDLYMTGMSYSEIARVLDREEKSTDNALQRIKNKIRKLL